MSEVRKSPNGGNEPSSVRTASGEASGLEQLTITKDGVPWAWTTLWIVRKVDSLSLVLIPRLRLEMSPTYQLVHVRSLLDVFKDCCFQAPGLEDTPFCIYGGTFMLYRSGLPELHNVITSLNGSIGDLARIIRLGTEALT